MRPVTALAVGFLGLSCVVGILRAQRPFKDWPAIEYTNFPIPKDANVPADWVRARLRYPDIYGYPNNSRLQMEDGRAFPGYWTMDYPRSDRHLLAGIRRLTRIDTRSAEQVVMLDGTDDIYNWPCLYAVEVGHWKLPQDQADQLRDYIRRGGFFMVDDFHGDAMWQGNNEWETFMASMTKVFPDAESEIQEIPNNDPIFHTIYDLDDRFQVPGSDNYFETHTTYEKVRRASSRTGAASATIRAGLLSRSATTWIWETAGKMRTIRSTRKSTRRSRIARASIISSTI